MGKPSGKKKRSGSNERNRHSSPRSFDEDTAMFIKMAQELKEEGNKFFQRRDHEAALLKYEKAIKLIPRTHIDYAYLRSNMAACYMQVGLSEYPMAINECNMALEFHPRYSKALLKRAKCYEALNRLDLAYMDVETVLKIEPNNLTALEIAERVKNALEKKGIRIDDNGFTLGPEYEIPCLPPPAKERRKKKSHKAVDDKKIEDKVVVEEKKDKLVSETKAKKVEENFDEFVKPKVEVTPEKVKEEEARRTVKLVLGEDIRWAQIPVRCSIKTLVQTVQSRYTNLMDFLIKYKDQEGDLITITSNEELRFAEASIEQQGSMKLYIVDVDPGQEQLFEKVKRNIRENGNAGKGKNTEQGSFYIDDWLIQFARVFKNHVGFNSDAYLDLHELGMKLYSDAMEETVTCEEAQEIFDVSAEKFREMAALALFNWGNVHMSKARKKVYLTDDASREDILAQVKTAYDWAQKEFLKAGMRYEEALNIKEDFYEAYLALGQQQFEQARLSWYYTIACQLDLDTFPNMEILQLFNNAENNMDKGMQMWEEMEEHLLYDSSSPDKLTTPMKKMGSQKWGFDGFDKLTTPMKKMGSQKWGFDGLDKLTTPMKKMGSQKWGFDGLCKDIISGEAAEQAANMRSQVNLLWGTILYERSVVEYKLELPSWEECLEVAVEKFELAGASPTDIAVMIKNHCANQTVVEGLGFKIDEIVQAWNEMYDAKRWKRGVPSFRLEPLFRRKVPNLHHVLEHL